MFSIQKTSDFLSLARAKEIIVMGLRLHPLTSEELIDVLSAAILSDRRCVIAHHNFHSAYIYYHDSKMSDFFGKADYVFIDSMPIVHWARILGYPLTRHHRVTYVDWIHPLMFAAELNGWRVFYLGGKPGVASTAAARLRLRYPRLKIDTHHGYFEHRENDLILEKIRDSDPNILMVGMGMPRQEHWVLDNLDRISANVILTSGACFDYLAGVIPTPPRWMGRIGLEWFFRLLSEPKRLWRRYLLEPWFLVPVLLRDVLDLRRHRARARVLRTHLQVKPVNSSGLP